MVQNAEQFRCHPSEDADKINKNSIYSSLLSILLSIVYCLTAKSSPPERFIRHQDDVDDKNMKRAFLIFCFAIFCVFGAVSARSILRTFRFRYLLWLFVCGVARVCAGRRERGHLARVVDHTERDSLARSLARNRPPFLVYWHSETSIYDFAPMLLRARRSLRLCRSLRVVPRKPRLDRG